MALSLASKIGAFSVVLLACAFVWFQRFSKYSGAFPALYVGMPYGMTEKDVPNLLGKTFLITGGSSGLGKATAAHLHAANANVIITCRKESNCDGAIEDITIRGEASDSQGLVKSVFVDLASLQSVKNASDHLVDVELDGIVLCAGIAAAPFSLSADGIESMFAVNHVAHFYLMQLIQDRVKPGGRVVVVTSSAHHNAKEVPTNLHRINHRKTFRPRHWYGWSKLANLLMAQELAARLAPRQIAVNAVHPGAVRSNIVRHVAKPMLPGEFGEWHAKTIRAFASSLMWDPDVAALTILYAAVSPEVSRQNVTGRYLIPIARLGTPSQASQNAKLQQEVWNFTGDLIDFKMREAKGWKYT